MRRRLDHVDLAVEQGVDGRLMIAEGLPHHTVYLRHLATGQTGGRLGARPVLREPRVDYFVARLPILTLEHEWAGAGGVSDLLIRRGVRHALGHHERHVHARLAERWQHEAGRLLQDDTKRAGGEARQVLDERPELRAPGVACGPAVA